MGVQINGDTGNISATKADYSGNVTIGGTLTYEDVTNIDSVGLITAREGLEIGARPGVAASISVDGNMIVSGITTIGGVVNASSDIKVGSGVTVGKDGDIFATGVCTATSFSGDGSNLTGITNATTVTVANETSDTETFPTFTPSATGDQNFKTNTSLKFNASNGTLTATSFAGSGAALTGISAGITEFDMWTLQTNHSADASSDILGVSGSSTILRHTSMNNSVAQAAQIGTGMSFDSSTGTFTFPSTGKYLVINNATISTYGSDNAGVMTRISTDGGSNFTTAALAYMGGSATGMHSGVSFNFVDVTNTSNIKVRFRQDSLGTNSYVVGNNGYARTIFIFARIGDT